MLLFWVLATLVILAALLLVVPALMRDGASVRHAPDEVNIALYRERLAELDRERDRGEVGTERYAALRQDLERRLLADVAELDEPRAVPHPPSYRMAVAIAFMMPVCGLGIYLWLGSPHGIDPPPISASPSVAADMAPSVETMVAALAARLDEDPGDAEGWLLLARSQVVLERFDAALAAFERAHALLGDDPSLLADWAEAEAGRAGSRFPASAVDRLDLALELDPDHEKALWLGGFAAAQNRRVEIAIDRWERLLARQSPGSREASIVTEMLAQVRDAESRPADPGSAPPAPTAAPAVTTGSAGGDESADGARIVVEVSLASDLQVELGAGEPVFVFARNPSGVGPPVAVARTIVGALPTTIVLDESNAMIPSQSLASVERALVTARVARSGTANRTRGDVEGAAGPVVVADSAPVRIVISQIVP
ncbi:MAG: c-type cytochrome biogenesis protein CcmI [Thiotrichales bacterium]|nr:c-type cytochrome biogenesis protein CcmI [Thiotrichales bacterium]